VRWPAIALVLVAPLLVAPPARADDELAEAHRLENALEYEKALVLVERIIAHGGADPARLANLHMLAGKLAAGLDRGASAEDHFARVLALRPDTRLPEGTSPKLTVRFEAARIRGIPPLRVTTTLANGVATISSEADPLGLVAGIAVRVVDASGNPNEVSDHSARRVAIPANARATEIAALDASGNRVWVGDAPAEQVVIAPPRPPEHHDVVDQRSAFAKWPTWAISAGAIAAIGGGFAWHSKSLQDEWNRLRAEDNQHDFSSLQSIEHRGRTYAVAADISFGVAGAAAIVSLILLATSHEPKPIVGITPGAATFGFAARF
jgi:hypothetical protein